MKVLIDKDDLKKFIIKANYADVQSARAVYERDCKIRGYILPRVFVSIKNKIFLLCSAILLPIFSPDYARVTCHA